MSLMLKLLATTLLLSSLVDAQSTSKKVEDFLSEEFGDNPRLKSVKVNVEEVMPLQDLKGWSAYILNVSAYLKDKPKDEVSQKMVWFSDGKIITKELTNMDTGENLLESIKPKVKPQYYSKANLIYGNANAKHRVAIFSDPLCPFCRGFVPKAIEDMKKEPNKFAVYYYHFPLARLHPAAIILVQAAAAAELQGVKDVILKLYTVEINSKERDVKKILAAFNKSLGTKITEKDLANPLVKKHIDFDMNVAKNLMVAGTPTLYLDDKIDKTKKKYQTIK